MWDDGRSLHYRSVGNEPNAEQLIRALAEETQWEIATYHEKFPLGLNGPLGKVSLEPGSQLEFSANPQASVGEAARIIDGFEKTVDKITGPWGLHWLGIALNPVATVPQMDVIPLTRYAIMTDYLGKADTLGTTMMRLTSSIQINFDYSSEEVAIEMLRVALALAPISYALFGNSPLREGKPTGWRSYRSEVWHHTDPDRQGLLPEAFEEGFNFARYAELVAKRPLMFAMNDRGDNVPAQSQSLVDISQGKLPGVGLNADNLLNPLRQFFTEARLKPGYVEVRSIDGLRVGDRYAAVAFWTGLMYSAHARAQVMETLGSITPAEREASWLAAGREGLRARVAGLPFQKVAGHLLELSRTSLLERGLGEEAFLEPVERTIADGKNPADRLLELFNGRWKGSVSELIRYCASRST